MTKFNFLDLTGLGLVKDKILEIFNSHISNNDMHVPSGGSEGQLLKRNADGTAEWASMSATSAETATKLQTPRNINISGEHVGSATFDGGEDITINTYAAYSNAVVCNKNNYPWHRFAKTDPITSMQDIEIIFMVSRPYRGAGWGLLRVLIRTEASVDGTTTAQWIIRNNLEADCVKLGFYNIKGNVYADLFYKSDGAYRCALFRVLETGTRTDSILQWDLINSLEVDNTTVDDPLTSYESYVSIENASEVLHPETGYTSIITPTDNGRVAYANSSDTIKTVQLVSDADLDTLKDENMTLYYAANGNTINNNPEAKQGFLLRVHRVSGANICQELVSQTGKMYIRHFFNSAWSDFKRVAYTTDNVASADKLNTDAGSATQPVYFKDGKPVATTYTLGKSVPADAKFTDTTYSALKNPTALTVQANGTSLGTYDGSSAKTFNITPSNIGASASNHTHNYAGSSSAGGAATTALACTGNSSTATKLQTARKINGVPFDGTSDINVVDTTAYQTVECKMAGVGWYRIMIGTNAFYRGVLNIARSWGTELPESLTLDISRIAQSFTVSVLSHEGARAITKIRMVQTSSNPYWNKAYIDLYYNSTKAGAMYMVVSDHKNARGFKVNTELSTSDATLNIVPEELEEGYTSTEIDISARGSYFPTSKIDELTVGSISGVNYAGSSSAGGAATTAFSSDTVKTVQLANDADLDTLTNTSFALYYASHGNAINNNPEAPYGFSLCVHRISGGDIVQELVSQTGNKYIRFYNSSKWSDFKRVACTTDNVASADKLNTDAGSATQPVYFKDGKPVATTYTLGKSVPSDAVFTDTTYSNFVKSGSGAKAGLVPAPSTTAGTTKYLREDGTWVVPPNTTYSAMTAATSSAAGKAGLVPAPAAGKQASFLRGDGTWVVPTDTKYTHPSYTARTGKPTANQTPAFGGTATVSQITSDATGHVTAATDRTITIPSTLSNGTKTAGLIKTTSTVTSNSGYTACPVINGVPYYKDTDTKYTHPTTAGNKHIPAGGSSGQVLGWSAAGTAAWTSEINAKKASQDGNGNVITSTYVVKNDPILMGGLKHGDVSITSASVSTSSAILAGNSGSKAAGYWSLAIGNDAKATGNYSRAYGANSTATGDYSQAYGANSTATGTRSIAMMSYANAIGDSSISAGVGTETQNYQFAIGYQNNTSNTTATNAHGISSGTIFTIGNGTSNSKSNAFRVQGDGKVYAKGAYSATGADYAEYAEWVDGNKNNEDRRGYFVTFDEENPTMIRKANAGEYILGIVSGNPCIIGNGDEDWRGRYILDEFGAFIEEQVEEEIEVLDHETGEFVKKTITVTKYKENPNYDSNQQYVTRAERKEWAAVGWIGVLSVRDDGTCKVGGYCKVADGGIATTAERGVDTYRVMERVTDNVVKVVLK